MSAFWFYNTAVWKMKQKAKIQYIFHIWMISNLDSVSTFIQLQILIELLLVHGGVEHRRKLVNIYWEFTLLQEIFYILYIY